jgi:hypothetical protein
MQQVIENQSTRLAEVEASAFSHQDESTGQGLHPHSTWLSILKLFF